MYSPVTSSARRPPPDAAGEGPGCAIDGTWCRYGVRADTSVKSRQISLAGGDECDHGLCPAAMTCERARKYMCKMGASLQRLECNDGGKAPCMCGQKQRKKSMFMLRPVDTWSAVALGGVESRWPSYFQTRLFREPRGRGPSW
jgi:hypothetical protein